MDDGTENQPVTERGGHVGDFHVPVALRHILAPLLEPLHARLPCHLSQTLYATQQQELKTGSAPAPGRVGVQ